ncbi:hypothetical protein OXIME_001246 [Oxyplasma meridianum]|uniref:Uncharacterized protein n=1 Tax=Oxyplasma meridianum TaxID=3073602 RepID=A0AAX4NHT8_9ARCH
MRRKVFYTGLVILIIGIVLVVSGSALLSGKLITGDSFQHVDSDVFVTKNLQFNGTTFLLVTNTSANISLIRTSDMPLAGPGNISNYAISPTLSIFTDRTYKVGSGNYTLIFFGKLAPHVSYEYILQSQEYLASLEVIGIVLGIIGFIVMMVGAFMKEKSKEDDIMKQFEKL